MVTYTRKPIDSKTTKHLKRLSEVYIFILLDILLRSIAEYFYELWRVKIQTTSKNSQRYYTTKRLIRDLLSNTPNWYVRASEFRGYLFTENAR